MFGSSVAHAPGDPNDDDVGNSDNDVWQVLRSVGEWIACQRSILPSMQVLSHPGHWRQSTKVLSHLQSVFPSINSA